MTDHAIGGVIAAITTPFSGDAPDPVRFVAHARWLMANGCDALNVLGTTGEATSIPAAARMTLMSAAAAALEPARLMVGTGCADLETTVALTRHAAKLGLGAALVLPPFYYKGVSEAGLSAYFDALVAATADRPIALYLYNFPQMTGLSFAPALVARLAQAHPDRIRGIKDSSGDLAYAGALTGRAGFKVFPSDETALAVARARGFAGCISATVNLSAPLAQRLWQTPDDVALRDAVAAFRAQLAGPGLIPGIKALVARLHDDPGHAAPRAPLMAPDAAEAARLAALTLPV
ncbi:dihydrodipicolinate synthase family protein [Rhodobaculum claviforme]|uniref:Dihydrodipicolinate synthase family protein n=1 Tax=Rhodobaculum claviforme TaxID=1549854 RepID=A0A934TIQ1_9RHOB|nr:dihydrodipicolinate synthase family protein [Rhodobaculum claviforme]MBK5926542.1 dihydrodipicolinate synthase family protein [Rhodobaculum claviforme]